jgi:hypothetical protein
MAHLDFLTIATLPPVELDAADKTPQTNSPMVKALMSCRSVAVDAGRLTCYDHAASALDEAGRKHDVIVLGREELRETRRSLFGFSLPKLPFFTGSNGGDENDHIQQIESAATGVRSLGYGKWGIILTDSVVWQTTEAANSDPRTGSHIRIKAASLGSYLMSIDGGRSVRAERGNWRQKPTLCARG